VRPAALVVIKGIHTVAFVAISGAILLFVWDGLRGRLGRRASVALSVALAESAIYVSNNQVCPLTPLAEELGAERGSVVDIFLPDWFSRRIPLVGSGALILGLVLHLRTWLRRSRPGGSVRELAPR
jgi:HAMP domain-containing protein